jgi:hypothetical protein
MTFTDTSGHVREQGHFPGPLDGDGELPLMLLAGTGGVPSADLALLRDEATQAGGVLVVDLFDLCLAELTRAALALAEGPKLRLLFAPRRRDWWHS